MVKLIKDSGERREFSTGAVRDISDDKGRCDLLPLDVVAEFLGGYADEEHLDQVLNCIDSFVSTGNPGFLCDALDAFLDLRGWREETMLLELAKHMADGAKKYGPYNWQRGIPAHCYIDSGVRHYLKWRRGDEDEPHDRAFAWNVVCCWWTCKHKPELCDVPWDKEENK